MLAAIGLVLGGTAILWGSLVAPVVVGAAAFSATVFSLFWNGKTQKLAEQGAIAILINLAILVYVLVLQWPDSGSSHSIFRQVSRPLLFRLLS